MSSKFTVRASELRQWLPRRSTDANKGRFGHALIVGGSRGMSGAVVLAARAALRSGAGLVTAAVPHNIQSLVAACVPEALTLGLSETQDGTIQEDAAPRLIDAHAGRNYSILAVGPGISHHLETAKAVLVILDALKIPAVVDADALNILAAQPRSAIRDLMRRREAPCVLTPHPGEMARLCGMTTQEVQADRAGAARQYAGDLGIVCLLKGQGTVITDGMRTAVNPTGNPGLAKGGSGDVLAGVIAALWSQLLHAGTAGHSSKNSSPVAVRKGVQPLALHLAQFSAPGMGEGAMRGEKAKDIGFKAAVLAAYLHGLSADIAVRDKTQYCLLASDVIETLPRAFRRLK